MSLLIGTTVEGDKPFNLPEDAATQTFAFIARKGAGKTYAAGKLIADILVESGRSLTLDVSQFSKADRQRFATAFGTRLWRNKKAQRSPSPLHLVIEESQLIVPEQGRGDTAAMVGIYEEIIRLGRNYGIGATMISQRPQSVNKEVLNQTECLFVLQVNGAHERKALREWIVHQGMDVKLLEELPGLPIGVAYVWSPQWLRVLAKVKIGRKGTFDSSATPRAGHKSARAGELKPLDLADLQSKMADAIERNKADDPRELRKQISALRAQLAKAGHATPVKEIEYVEVVPEQVKSWFERLASSTENLSKTFAQEALAMRADLDTLLTNRNPPRKTRYAPARPSPGTRPLQRTGDRGPAARPAAESVTARECAAEIGKGERIVLAALIQHGDVGCTNEQLSVITGYKRSSRNTYLNRLRALGLIQSSGERHLATAAGSAALPDVDPLPTGKELQRYWLDRLTGGEKALLAALISAYPNALSRKELGETENYGRSSRNTYIQRLLARQLVKQAGGGQVVASEVLF